MKELKWDPLKSAWLKRARGLSFEEIIQERFIAVRRHPRRLHQNLMLFERQSYIGCVPYVDDDDWIILKTLYPRRQYTAMFRKGELTS